MSTRRPAFASVSTSTTSHVAGEKGREREEHIALLSDGVCVCFDREKERCCERVGVFEKRERERKRERGRERMFSCCV